jgi:hypothetical protein
MSEVEIRVCIKCNRELPIGMFDDTWRSKTNICKDCVRAYQREYRKEYRVRYKSRLKQLEKEIKSLNSKIEYLESRLTGQKREVSATEVK